MTSVYTDYLQEKQDNKERVNVYLKSKTSSKGKIVSRMLSGYIKAFDEVTLQLTEEECIIERSDIISIKPDKEQRRYGN